MNEISAIPSGATTPENEEGTLPHHTEAEQQLLGAILTNNDVYDRVAQIIKPEHFYEPVHARIFEIAAQRISKNALASPVTLKAFMEDDEASRNWAVRPIWPVWRGCDQLLRRARLCADDL